MKSSHDLGIDALDRHNGTAPRAACGWCGGLLREWRQTGAPSAYGLCPRCAQVLDGPTGRPLRDDAVSALEDRVNVLMCQLYQTRQLLLGVQQRVRTDAELLARVGQALVSVRQQERVVAEIQQALPSDESASRSS